MNYIQLINKFWTMNDIHAFSSTEIALYFYLLKVNNMCKWKVEFKHNNQKILASISVSFNTFKVAREGLKKAGLISFESQNGNPNATYSLLTSSNFDEVLDEVSDEVAPSSSKFDEVSNEVTTKLSSSKDKHKHKVDRAPTQNFSSDLETRKQNFQKQVAGLAEKFPSQLLRDFYHYWIEPSKTGKKMRFELERTWDLNLRVMTWQRNEDKFGRKTSSAPPQSGSFVIGQKHNAAG